MFLGTPRYGSDSSGELAEPRVFTAHKIHAGLDQDEEEDVEEDPEKHK